MTVQEYQITGMDCANCALTIEKGVSRLQGVDTASVDLGRNRLKIIGTPNQEVLFERVKALGYGIMAETTSQTPATPQPQPVLPKSNFWYYLRQRNEMQYVFVGLCLMVIALLTQLVALDMSVNLLILATGIASAPTLLQGIKGLMYSHSFTINLLTAIAVLGAVALGEYWEALLVVVLFNIGEAMEGYVADRARASLRSLQDLTPRTAIRVIHGMLEETVTVEQLKIGDVVLVKPHEMIPMDAEVLQGTSAVNQAPITGESIPVDKVTGDQVFAGTINGQGVLHMQVTRLAQDNTLNRLISLIEETASQRAPTQRLIESFAEWYTPLVLVLAILTATIPTVIFGEPLTGENGWLYRALTLLIIACPCALVLSAPITVISAITAAARGGILIKGGLHLENLGRLKVIAFDKTGTLTTGSPQVKTIFAVDGNENDLLALASAVERRSTHPIARAITHAATERHLLENYQAIGIEALVGAGIAGEVNGKRVIVASPRYIMEHYPVPESIQTHLQTLEQDGQTTLLVYDGEQVRGFMTVADTLRPESSGVIANFHRQAIQTVMLTGDNLNVAQRVGQAVGVDDIRANLLPEDKLTHVRALTAKHLQVGMVGDGVNDAPALASATVGIAMGASGSAQALETADVALMAEGLYQLPTAIRIGRFARQLIQQNILLSIGMKLVFVALALAGFATLWMAVLADVGMLIVVALNGMRPLRMKH